MTKLTLVLLCCYLVACWTLPIQAQDKNPLGYVNRYDATFTCASSVTSTFFRRNKEIYNKCVKETGYSIFPYPGFPPTTAQMKAICQSSTCIMFLQGALKLNIPECVLNGIGIKSITETILKIAQDRKEGFDQLTSKQVDQILQWRSRRNRAKEKGEEYDNISLGAIDFDEKLSRNMESSTVVVLTNYLISNSNNSGDVFSGAEASEVGIGARSRGSSSSDKLKEQMWTDSSSLSTESTVARNSTPNWRLLVSLFVISLSWIYPFY